MSRKKTFKLDSGAEYTVDWDDSCVYFKGGVTHIEPRLLPLLMDYAWEQRTEDMTVPVPPQRNQPNKGGDEE